jgi:hypothetical protein
LINKFYYWLWHTVLHLPQPISWIIVDSIKKDLLWWDVIGGGAVLTAWVLTMHFIKMS